MSNSELTWQSGHNDFKKVTLNGPEGASADMYEHGAHLTRWTTASGYEGIFLSEQAQFNTQKAIRGGVPIIFPQFNEFGPGPRHGFARTSQWRLQPGPESGRCRFTLAHNPHSLTLWPRQFEATFDVELQPEALKMTLSVTNLDPQPFTFTAALHTYLAIDGLYSAELGGLNGLRYWDNDGSDWSHRHEFTNDTLTFSDALDRVFFAVRKPLELRHAGHRLGIQQSGFLDAVVWNPGAEATAGMADMADEEYQQMLCVEAALIDNPAQLAPGETWSGSQTLVHMPA